MRKVKVGIVKHSALLGSWNAQYYLCGSNKPISENEIAFAKSRLKDAAKSLSDKLKVKRESDRLQQELVQKGIVKML